MIFRWPNHALQRTRPSRCGCSRGPSWAGSLSLGRCPEISFNSIPSDPAKRSSSHRMSQFFARRLFRQVSLVERALGDRVRGGSARHRGTGSTIIRPSLTNGGPSQNRLSGSAPDGQFAAQGGLACRPVPLARLARSEWAAVVAPDFRATRKPPLAVGVRINPWISPNGSGALLTTPAKPAESSNYSAPANRYC